MKHSVRAVLGGLIALDLVLSIAAFFFPALWFEMFHGAAYVDPQGLLRRCGANWLAFFVIQVVALLRWERERCWLAVVAGMRLGDTLTDITCLMFAASATRAAWILFPLAGIGNLVVGAWLLRRGEAGQSSQPRPGTRTEPLDRPRRR
jgi:hypothetical protein